MTTVTMESDLDAAYEKWKRLKMEKDANFF